ncbi:MAG: hexitol phosphatase HxpB [Anaerolineae bacterium]|nr:MAG: hexitol phosphatase HxpB [Anaerolineae bacterium]
MIEAVIFDMDGLLIDSEPFWQEAEITTFANVGLHLTEQDCTKTMGLRLDEVVEFWYRYQSWNHYSKKEIEDAIKTRYLELVRERGEAKTGVMETLRFMQAQNIPMAIASSSYMELIECVVERLAIGPYLTVLCSAEYEPFGKPNPSVYLSAADKLGVSRLKCLVFEDSFRGLLAAKAAEMKCVCVPDPSLAGDPRLSIADKVIPTLAHFDAALWSELNA